MKSTKKLVSNFSIFDWLKEICYIKSDWNKFSNEQLKTFEPYMINRFLSMNEDYTELVNYVQAIPYSEKEKYYKLYCNLLPKKQFWSKYIKSETKSPNKDLIHHLTIYFECSSKDVTDYIGFLDKTIISQCLSDMGIEDKEIKKLIK